MHIRYKRIALDVDTVYLHPIGDLHIGHENSNIDFFLQELKAIPKTPNHRIILMGDLLDVGIKTSVGGSVYDQIYNIDTAMDFLHKFLLPYRNQIDAVVAGNHEWRIYKEAGIDLSKQIAERLGVPYMKHSGIVTYSFMKRAYNINFIHGKSGGSVENALRNVKAMANKVVADVYLMGHVHHSAHTKRQIKTIDSRNGKVIEVTQKFVLAGHSLEYDDSYADQMNLEISTKGFPVVVLHGLTDQKKIDVID